MIGSLMAFFKSRIRRQDKVALGLCFMEVVLHCTKSVTFLNRGACNVCYISLSTSQKFQFFFLLIISPLFGACQVLVLAFTVQKASYLESCLKLEDTASLFYSSHSRIFSFWFSF